MSFFCDFALSVFSPIGMHRPLEEMKRTRARAWENTSEGNHERETESCNLQRGSSFLNRASCFFCYPPKKTHDLETPPKQQNTRQHTAQ